jgi:protein-S-isoprenylcysteine O-methyltransferase Ste14
MVLNGADMNLAGLWVGLMWTWFALEVGVASLTRTSHGGGKVQDRGTMLLMWLSIVGAMVGCDWMEKWAPAEILNGAQWLKPLSLGILVTGLLIRVIAILELGKSFSANVAIREKQTVKRNGLYRFVRHPSYTGLWLVWLAIGLHSRVWSCLALMLVPTTAALLYRIHVEEAALREAFGEEYVEYSRVTKRLLPGVY